MKTASPQHRDRAAAMSLGWNMIDLEAIKGHSYVGGDGFVRASEDRKALIAEVERQQGEIERLREAVDVAKQDIEKATMRLCDGGKNSVIRHLANATIALNAALTPPEIKS